MGESSAAVDNLAGQAKALQALVLDMQREGEAKAESA
jgi:methyl-accepting chemotaxis protein